MHNVIESVSESQVDMAFNQTISEFTECHKGNNKITALRTILQRESQNSCDSFSSNEYFQIKSLCNKTISTSTKDYNCIVSHAQRRINTKYIFLIKTYRT
jgi:hypothetical protein